ncbi:MAG: dockerin type I repeat-containing protein [Clostridia bacterium]|nr:dockerin type I repeat-containing protein [Clostridia bacterium]
MTTIDTKTMYVDYGTVVDNTFVAYSRTYVIVGGVYLYDGDYLATGGYKSTTDKPSTGGYAYYTVNDRGVGVLELFDFEVSESSFFNWGRSGSFEGEQASVSSPYDLKLILKGENAITPEKYDYGIAIYGSLSVEGDGSLDIGDDEHSDGILILGDYATDDIAFVMESGSLNVYSENSILLYCFDYDKDATITINDGSLFMRSIVAEAADNAEGIIEINGGKLEISGTGIVLLGVGKTGYYQNGGIVEIEATTAESSIVEIYNRDNEFGGYFEIYGGEFSVREKNGEDVITTTCDSPVLGQGMAVVEGDWDTAYIKIAKESSSTDHDYMLGDVNNDGAIDQYDYILVKRHYFGTRILTDDEMTRADVNGDGVINQYDYILIKRHYFGTYTIG